MRVGFHEENQFFSQEIDSFLNNYLLSIHYASNIILDYETTKIR